VSFHLIFPCYSPLVLGLGSIGAVVYCHGTYIIAVNLENLSAFCVVLVFVSACYVPPKNALLEPTTDQLGPFLI
jgi:hypothetical protein